jgi:hypothetical protein
MLRCNGLRIVAEDVCGDRTQDLEEKALLNGRDDKVINADATDTTNTLRIENFIMLYSLTFIVRNRNDSGSLPYNE